MHPLFDLTGHVALVTGGNSGIGLGMADGLATAGADVCIWGTNAAKNAAAAEHLGRHGTRVVSVVVDVGDEDAVVHGMQEVAGTFGSIDSCFANAAVTGQRSNSPFVDSTLEVWRGTMRVNLDGTYLTFREAARQMIAQGRGGSLVATSTIATQFGAPREQPYAASKGGVEAMVRGIAVELARYGIRANTLLPAWTLSPLMEPWAHNPAVADRIKARIPMRRFADPSEWGGVAVYLAGNASSWQTGETIRLDGGYSVF